MTQLEFDEITIFLNPKDKKNKNNYSTLGINYHYQDNLVTITGNIPRNIIQNIAITFPELKTFMNHLSPTEGDQKYIKKIVLNDIKEVVIFSLFMEDYYILEKTGLRSNSSDSYMELITEIEKSLIEKCDLSITSIEWIRLNPICHPVLLATQNRLNKNTLIKTSKKVEEQQQTRKLKKSADDFDYIVNPFMGNNKKNNKLEDILKHINISLDNNEDNEVKMILSDKQTNTTLIHERKKNGFINTIIYANENREVVTIKHEFDSSTKLMPHHGEKIIIIKDSQVYGKSILFYNFTTNKIKQDGNNEYLANMEDKLELYSELQQAMNIAEETVLQYILSQKKYVM